MQRGFTIIELIIYMAIIALIGGAVTSYTLGVSQSRSKNTVTQEVQMHGRTALQLVSQKIRNATGVNIASSTIGTNPGVLTLTYAESSKNPTVIDLTAENGRMRIQEGTSTPVVITPETMRIGSLVFTNLTASSLRENIRVQLRVDYATTTDDVIFTASETFQTSVSVRQ